MMRLNKIAILGLAIASFSGCSDSTEDTKSDGAVADSVVGSDTSPGSDTTAGDQGVIADAGAPDTAVADAAIVPAEGKHLWSKRYGVPSAGTSTDERTINGVAFDSAGDIAVAGLMEGAVDFGGGVLQSLGSRDVFVGKFDKDGKHLWSKRFGDDGRFQIAFAVATDGSKNIIATGEFDGTLDFGGGPLSSKGGRDIFIAKFDKDGKHLWSKSFGSKAGSMEAGRSVAVDSMDNIWLVGNFNGAVDFGGGELTTAGNQDAFIAKFDKDGKHLWSKQFGDDFVQKAKSVAIDSQDNGVVVGISAGTTNFGGTDIVSPGGSDPFAAKFDKDGKHLWSKGFGGKATRQEGVAVAIDGQDNVVLVAHFEGTVNFGGTDFENPAFRSKDVAIAKLDKDGKHLWSKQYGDESSQFVNDVTIDSRGDIVFTGSFKGDMDFGGGVMHAISSAVYLTKLDGQGAQVWAKKIGGTEDNLSARCVAVNGDDEIVMAGRIKGDEDLGGGMLTSTKGDFDVLLVKYSR